MSYGFQITLLRFRQSLLAWREVAIAAAAGAVVAAALTALGVF